MILKDLLSTIWRRKWIIIITTIFTMVVVIVGTYMATPLYVASATMRISSAAGGSISYTDYVYNDRLVNTYVQVGTSGPVLEDLARRLGLVEPPDVKVEIVSNTELLKISAEYTDAATAQQAANTLAIILIEQSKTLYTSGGKDTKEILAEQLTQIEQELKQGRSDYDALVREAPSDSEAIAAASRLIELKQNTYATLLDQYEQTRLREALRENVITVVEPATLPEKPTKPNKLINYGLGAVLGVLAGMALVLLFSHFDTTLYTTEEIERTIHKPILGKIPTVQRKALVLDHHTGTIYGEAFHRLRVGVLRRILDDGLRTLMISSAEPNEGKSTIATNLAISLAQAGKQVILVDCDAYLPSIHSILGLQNERGLSDVLSGTSSLKDVLQPGGTNGLQVLTSGVASSDTQEGLQTRPLPGGADRIKRTGRDCIAGHPRHPGGCRYHLIGLECRRCGDGGAEWDDQAVNHC